MIHLTRRALQVLEGRDVDAELLTLCGYRHLPSYEALSRFSVYHEALYRETGSGRLILSQPATYTYDEARETVQGDAITEAKIRNALLRSLETNRYPTWEEETLEGPGRIVLSPRGLCPNCAREFRFDLNEAFAIALDRLREEGLTGPPKRVPYSRSPGESPTEQLQEFLRQLGPQPRHMLERFVWSRAHPDEVDEQERLKFRYGDDPFLILERQSSGFWSTNWRGMVDRGTLVRLEDENGRALYAAPRSRR